MFNCVTLLFLVIYAGMDIHRKRIWWPASLIFIVAAAAAHFILADMNIWNMTAGIFLGIGLLILSWVTREAIGYGDGLTVAACGAALGFTGAFLLLVWALCFAAVWSVILLVLKKAGKKDSFPFIPFLLAAQICISVIN